MLWNSGVNGMHPDAGSTIQAYNDTCRHHLDYAKSPRSAVPWPCFVHAAVYSTNLIDIDKAPQAATNNLNKLVGSRYFISSEHNIGILSATCRAYIYTTDAGICSIFIVRRYALHGLCDRKLNSVCPSVCALVHCTVSTWFDDLRSRFLHHMVAP